MTERELFSQPKQFVFLAYFSDCMQEKNKQIVVLALLILMLIGGLLSRVLLSVSTIAFFVYTCFNFKSKVTAVFREPVTAGMLLLFFVPFVSGLWSSNTDHWIQVMVDKLPFLLMPFALFSAVNPSATQWKQFGLIVISILFMATLWSTFHYLMDMRTINESYLRAKTIPVLMNGDHLRFSWLTAIGLMYTLLLLGRATSIKHKLIFFLLAGWFFGYLHVLAARTGLLAAYLFMLGYLIYVIKQNKSGMLKWITPVLLVVIGLIAWFSAPTLRNRFLYTDYTYRYIQRNEYLSGSSDGNRVLSLRAGWELLNRYTWGVGSGDAKQQVAEWYRIHIPGMLESDQIFPSNEWLIYGMAMGWLGVLLFTIALMLPFFTTLIKNRFFWNCFHGVLFLIAMTDSSLEVQFGVFIYTFVVYWWWKEFRTTV